MDTIGHVSIRTHVNKNNGEKHRMEARRCQDVCVRRWWSGKFGGGDGMSLLQMPQRSVSSRRPAWAKAPRHKKQCSLPGSHERKFKN